MKVKNKVIPYAIAFIVGVISTAVVMNSIEHGDGGHYGDSRFNGQYLRLR